MVVDCKSDYPMPRIPNSANISFTYDINFKTIFNIYLWNLLHRCMLIVTDAVLNFPFNEIGCLLHEFWTAFRYQKKIVYKKFWLPDQINHMSELDQSLSELYQALSEFISSTGFNWFRPLCGQWSELSDILLFTERIADILYSSQN